MLLKDYHGTAFLFNYYLGWHDDEVRKKAKYLKLFDTHTDYETYINGQDAVKPNVSYCEDDNGVHYNPYIHDYSNDYFTTEALESGTISFIIGSGVTTTELTSMSYSTDNGETWNTTNNTDDKSSDLTIAVNVNSGDKVLWKGVANNMYKSYNAYMNVMGNIMSLLYGDNYAWKAACVWPPRANLCWPFVSK